MDQICDRCDKLIKHGDAYVTITREVEYLTDDLHEGYEVSDVIDAEGLKTFCISCGEMISANKIKEIIELFIQDKLPLDSNLNEK